MRSWYFRKLSNLTSQARHPHYPHYLGMAAALLMGIAALLLTDCFAGHFSSGFSSSRAAEPEQNNLLQNGGFEAGLAGLALTALPGWTVTRGTVDVLNESAAEGGKCLDLIGSPGVGAIRQTFATEAGRKYVVSGFVAHHPGVGEAGANLYVNGALLAPLHHNTPNSPADLKWARFTREFTATSASTTLAIEDRNLAGYEFGGTHLDGLSVMAMGDTLAPPSTGAAVIIDGTDYNQHGSRSGGKNREGWLYMQKALESLSLRVSPGTAKVVVDLGTTSGKPRDAIFWAFEYSSLKSAGWTLRHVDGSAAIGAWLSNLSTANTGILYIPTYNLIENSSVGDISPDEMAAINAGAAKIAGFVNRGSGDGGGVFAMGEVDEAGKTGAWGWLRSLFPGLNVVTVIIKTDIDLTPDGIAAFPGLHDPDLALIGTEAWHNYFTGDLATLKVLGEGLDNQRVKRNVIIGGIGIVVPTPSCPTVSNFSPASGQTGASVAITGTNLTGVTSVKFANNADASFTVNSDTQLTASVPAGAGNGPIVLSKPGCPDVATGAFTVLSNGNRVVRVGCASGRPGGTVTLPIELLAMGDENAVGGSLRFDPAVLGNPQIARGADAGAALLNVNASQNGQGRIGFALALPSGQRFAAGTRQLAVATFTVAPNTTLSATAVEFSDAPIRTQVASADAQPLDASFQGCTNVRIEIVTGYEADVTPRPNGKNDGSISITDWVQIGRFVAGLDTVSSAGEFLRADCAPRADKGDGRLELVDWVQAGRYAAGLDAPQTVGGPAAASGLAASGDSTSAFTEAVAHARHLRILDTTLERGQTGTVAVEIEAEGDENAAGISLEYDPAALRFVSASTGDGVEGALLNVNSNESAAGRIGLAMALPAGKTLKEGKQTLLLLRFTALSGGNAASTPLGFGDRPIRRQLADANANAIAGSYENGTIRFGNVVTSVSAASFKAEAAPESILAAFGAGLANTVAAAAQQPLPTTLAGTTLKVKDAAGVERLAPLFFVAPMQVNYLMPAGVAPGAAIITITSGDGNSATGSVHVTAVAPSLFTANSDGRGAPAAVLLRVKANGEQVYEPVARFDAAQNRFVPAPIDPGAESDQLYLLLFGSGFRHRANLSGATAMAGNLPAEVLFAGAQGGMAGLDQLNLRLPRALAGRGIVEIVVTVDGRAANPVRIVIGNALP